MDLVTAVSLPDRPRFACQISLLSTILMQMFPFNTQCYALQKAGVIRWPRTFPNDRTAVFVYFSAKVAGIGCDRNWVFFAIGHSPSTLFEVRSERSPSFCLLLASERMQAQQQDPE